MFSNLEYFFVLLACVSLPALLYFHPNYPLKKNLKWAFLSILISAIPYILWDIWATEQGHWSFNPKYILNIYIFNLPVEEVAFFLVIPFCITFVWSIISQYSSLKDLYKRMFTF